MRNSRADRPISAATCLVLVLLAGCGAGGQAEGSSLPRHDGSAPTAAFQGRLHEVDGCLRIELDGIDDLPVLWPPDWELADDGRGVIDPEGERFEIGETREIGGGVGPRIDALPPRCTGAEAFFLAE